MNAADSQSLAAFQCQRIICTISNRLDAGDYAGGLAYYLADAVWTRPEAVLKGREAIAGFYAARPVNAVICHVLTNFEVTFEGESTAVCTYYSMGFRQMAEGTPSLPVAMPGPGVIWRYHDTLHLTEEGWRVAGRHADRIYEVGA